LATAVNDANNKKAARMIFTSPKKPRKYDLDPRSAIHMGTRLLCLSLAALAQWTSALDNGIALKPP
jgi:hypothetical protein